MQNLKYKTEKHLKERLYELAITNKKLLDLLTFNIQDLEAGAEKGLTAEECAEMLERTVNYVKEVSNANKKAV